MTNKARKFDAVFSEGAIVPQVQYVVSPRALDAFRELVKSRDGIARFMSDIDRARAFMKALIMTDADDSKDLAVFMYSCDNAVHRFIEHSENPESAAEEVMRFINTLRDEQIAQIYASDGTVSELCEHGYADEIMDFIRDANMDDVARIFATDGAIPGLIDAGHCQEVMDMVRLLGAPELRNALSSDDTVASLVEQGYGEEVWNHIDTMSTNAVFSVLAAKNAVYALTETPEEAHDVMEKLRDADQNQRRRVLCADNAIFGLVEHGYWQEIARMVADLPADIQGKVYHAEGAEDALSNGENWAAEGDDCAPEPLN